MVEHLLGIIHKGTTTELISDHLITFLKSSGFSLEKMRGLDFDGASDMSGHRSGVQKRMHPQLFIFTVIAIGYNLLLLVLLRSTGR